MKILKITGERNREVHYSKRVSKPIVRQLVPIAPIKNAFAKADFSELKKSIAQYQNSIRFIAR